VSGSIIAEGIVRRDGIMDRRRSKRWGLQTAPLSLAEAILIHRRRRREAEVNDASAIAGHVKGARAVSKPTGRSGAGQDGWDAKPPSRHGRWRTT